LFHSFQAVGNLICKTKRRLKVMIQQMVFPFKIEITKEKLRLSDFSSIRADDGNIWQKQQFFIKKSL
jgi:hypothetical protein